MWRQLETIGQMWFQLELREIRPIVDFERSVFSAIDVRNQCVACGGDCSRAVETVHRRRYELRFGMLFGHHPRIVRDCTHFS